MASIEATGDYNTLRKWSTDPQAEASRLTRLSPELRQREFFKNLDTYTNEVIENQPVSLSYDYWFDYDGHLYTGPERLPIQRAVYQIDERERQGLPRAGFEKLERSLLDNPGEVVLWYSPKGPAAFSEDPENPYSEINYDYGQLYIQQFDGEKVEAIAVKVTNENAVRTLFHKAGLGQVEGVEGSHQAIRDYLLSPQPLPLSLAQFIDHDWDLPVVFTDKNRGTYYWSDIAREIWAKFSGKKPAPLYDRETIDMLNKRIITQEDVMRAYLLTIKRAMDAQGITKLGLSGSCGGEEIDRSDIDAILGLKSNLLSSVTLFSALFGGSFKEIVGLYSSGFRMATQNEKKTTYKPGTCKDCGMHKTKVGDCHICTDCEVHYN